MKILLADDSVTAQNMGKKILSEAGHEVTCVSNGSAALKKASEQEPDLVILDIYMPGYSGLEVCQRLKENPATAGLPIVLTVGKLEPFRKEDAQRVRAEALIVKPFEASELAAAVARFGEIAAAQAPKVKSRGKLGPQAKPKPQWEEAPEEDFVTTTRKLEEEEETAAPVETFSKAAAQQPEEPVEATPAAAASEFAVAPEAAGSEFSPATQAGAGSEEAFSEKTATEATETSWPASESAEFRVEAEVAHSTGDQPEPPAMASLAAAASAGANFATGVTEAPEFAVAPPSEAAAAEPATFVSPIAADEPSLPQAPEMSAVAAPEISAATPEPFTTPGVDPAFDPDRTQWATAYPTRFGIAEEQETEEETVEPAARQEPQAEATSTAPDEIAAILSNLPGGMAAAEEPRQSTEGGQFGQRPWPVENSGSGEDGWKAEEVPVEDRDSSISLAEEMDKALGAGMENRVPSSFAEAPATPEEMQPAVTLERSEEAAQPGPAAAVEVAPSHAGEEQYHPEEAEPAAAASVFGQAVSAAPGTPDRVAGVMQSAAMAIATRATVSAVASQLHGQPAAESASTGPSAIEELVGQVLERLKPKLIAEIKRELETPEK